MVGRKCFYIFFFWCLTNVFCSLLYARECRLSVALSTAESQTTGNFQVDKSVEYTRCALNIRMYPASSNVSRLRAFQYTT